MSKRLRDFAVSILLFLVVRLLQESPRNWALLVASQTWVEATRREYRR